MMKGKHTVLAGTFLARAQGRVNEFLPERLKAQLMRRLSEPGSAARHTSRAHASAYARARSSP